MSALPENQLKNLQENLALIRKAAGMTSQQLADKLGCTKQLISAIENGRQSITVMQYRAIRNVLNELIVQNADNNTNNTLLPDLIDALVDHPESYTPEQLEQIMNTAQVIVPSISFKDELSATKASAVWSNSAAGKLGMIAGFAAGIALPVNPILKAAFLYGAYKIKKATSDTADKNEEALSDENSDDENREE